MYNFTSATIITWPSPQRVSVLSTSCSFLLEIQLPNLGPILNPRGFNSEILLLITSEKDPIARCGHFHWSLGLGLGHTLQGALLPTLPVLHIRATNVTLGSLSLELPQAIIWKI